MSEVLLERAARGVPVLFSSHQLELVDQLCESVAIIDHGRLVACGPVDELRAAGPRLLRIDVRSATPGVGRCAHRCRADRARRRANGVQAFPGRGSSADPRCCAAVRLGDPFRRTAADARGAVSRGGVRMSAQRAVWEVARRELVERSRSRVLRVTLVLLLILSVGGAVAAARLSGRTPTVGKPANVATDDSVILGSRAVVVEERRDRDAVRRRPGGPSLSISRCAPSPATCWITRSRSRSRCRTGPPDAATRASCVAGR